MSVTFNEDTAKIISESWIKVKEEPQGEKRIGELIFRT